MRRGNRAVAAHYVTRDGAVRDCVPGLGGPPHLQASPSSGVAAAVGPVEVGFVVTEGRAAPDDGVDGEIDDMLICASETLASVKPISVLGFRADMNAASTIATFVFSAVMACFRVVFGIV